MVKVQVKQEPREILGIEKLMSNLEHASEDTRRLPREVVTGIIRQLQNEIPYASKIIPTQLADYLLSDAPQIQTNLTLNQTLVNLAKAVCNAEQIDTIDIAVQTYIRDRKTQEKEYAALLLNEIVTQTELQPFPASVHPALRELAQSILEKIVNEKQLRKAPGYRLQPLLSIIEPFLFQRLMNAELNRLKAAQSLLFRKFVNSVAHNGYEKIIDDNKLILIHKEKETAFNTFKNNIADKVPPGTHLKKFQEDMLFIQQDKIQRHAVLKAQLNELLKSTETKLKNEAIITELKSRFNEKLRRTLYFCDQNHLIYHDEKAITKAHEQVFHEVENDIDAIVKLIAIVLSIEENYTKKFLQQFFGSQHLKSNKAILFDTILGKITLKIDPDTLQKLEIRMGGYPQKNVIDLYAYIITRLKNTLTTITGVYSEPLKAEFIRAIAELETAKNEIYVPTRAPVKPVVSAAPVEQPLPSILSADLTKITVPLTEPKAKVEPVIPVAEKPVEEKPAQPVIEKPIEATPVAAVEEKPIEEKPAPLIEEKPAEPMAEPQQTAAPIEATAPLETAAPVEPPPPAVEPQLPVEPPVPVAPAEPATSVLDEQFDLEPVVFEPVKPTTPPPPPPTEAVPAEPAMTAEPASLAAQTAIDGGIRIMKNYQLGFFEKPVLQAWQTMVTASAEGNTSESGIGSDNEVRLYVICDLAQQVSSVQEATLDEERKQVLQNIKNQLIEALKNPLDDTNWDYFEGTQRDIIDGALSALLS